MYQYIYLAYRTELIKFQANSRAATYDLVFLRINSEYFSELIHIIKGKKKSKVFNINISNFPICSF